MTVSERLTRLQGLGLFKLFLDCLDDDFWVFFFGTGALRLLVFLSNILDENKISKTDNRKISKFNLGKLDDSFFFTEMDQ